MMERFKKLQVKGFVAGFLVCLLIFSTTMVFANPQTVTRQITYGVNINLNGQVLQLDTASRAFTMDGRTFLPLRAISEALDIPVDFDPATNTVFLGNRFEGQRISLNRAAPFHDSGGSGWNVVNATSVTMGGTNFQNAIQYSIGAFVSGANTGYSLHNLNGQYRIFSGHMGRIDGSGMHNVTVNIIGDGTILRTYELEAGDLPKEFSILVEDVRLLRVEFVTERANFRNTSRSFALVGFLE